MTGLPTDIAARFRAALARLRTEDGRLGRWPRRILLALLVAPLLVIALAVVVLMTPAVQKQVVSNIASAALQRTVVFDGGLSLRPGRRGVDARFAGLRVGQPAWAPKGEMVQVGRGEATLEFWPLLVGRVSPKSLTLDGLQVNLLRTADGKVNWRTGGDNQDSVALKLPKGDQLTITNGRLRVDDQKRQLKLDAVFETVGHGQIHLHGPGSAKGEALTLNFLGASPLGIKEGAPYPFSLHINTASTNLKLVGTMVGGLNLGAFTARVDSSGVDLARLYNVTNLVAPNTPPYDLSAQISRAEDEIRIKGLSGRLGRTDVAGDMQVTMGGVTKLRADIVSQSLDLEDLRAIVGGKGSSTAAPAKSLKPVSVKMLPTATLDVGRIRNLDAVLHYRAVGIQPSPLAARSGKLDLVIKDGVIKIAPFTLAMANGRIEGAVTIAATSGAPNTDIDVRVIDMPLQDLKIKSGGFPAQGVLQASAKLKGQGFSVQSLAANGKGTITVRVGQGSVDKTAASLLGGDVAAIFTRLFSGKATTTPLNCAVATFDISDGIMTSKRLEVDTGVATATGRGQINLRDESLHFRLDGASKVTVFNRSLAPVFIGGSLSKPSVSVNPASLALQGVPTVLNTLLSPVQRLFRKGDPPSTCGAE